MRSQSGATFGCRVVPLPSGGHPVQSRLARCRRGARILHASDGGRDARLPLLPPRSWSVPVAVTLLLASASALSQTRTPAGPAPADKALGVAAIRAAERLGTARYAVVIGINDYQDPQIPDLKYAEADARAVHETLTDPQIGGIEKKNAILLLGREATTRNVRKALTDLRTIPKDATVFIFFSGHGAKEAGEAFWVTYDSELGGLAYSALPDREIRALTDKVPSNRLIMLLDCCYAAATVKEQKSVTDIGELLRQFVGKGRVTITASGSGEEAIEAPDLQPPLVGPPSGGETRPGGHGVFTHFLVEAMRGKADGESGEADGIITVPELTAYVDRTVADAARRRRGIQKPAIFMEEVQEPGKFLVTVDPGRLAAIAEQQRRQSEQVQARLAAIKKLFIDEQITESQYVEGKRLLSAERQKLDEQDRERFDIFVELAEGKIPPNRLQPLLDAVETPEQRAARLERERRAAEEAKRQAEFDGYLSAARRIAERAGLDGTPPTAVPPEKARAAQQAIEQLDGALALRPDDTASVAMKRRLEAWIGMSKALTLDLGNGVKLELVLIPAGEFVMGLPDSEEERDSDEGPQHRVRIAQPFYMGRYEVTQAQWEAVMGSNPSHFKGDGRLPVENVSWNDCQEFCKRLSAKVGRTVRLPTEAEWEYACRAGTGTPFHFGGTISTDQANYNGKFTYGNGRKGVYREKTTVVGSFAANAWGLHDMHGNVWEWCEDVWHEGYAGAPTDGSAWVSGGNAEYRVLRGGSWDGAPRICRSANRGRSRPDSRYGNIGLRVGVSMAARGTPG